MLSTPGISRQANVFQHRILTFQLQSFSATANLAKKRSQSQGKKSRPKISQSYIRESRSKSSSQDAKSSQGRIRDTPHNPDIEQLRRLILEVFSSDSTKLPSGAVAEQIATTFFDRWIELMENYSQILRDHGVKETEVRSRVKPLIMGGICLLGILAVATGVASLWLSWIMFKWFSGVLIWIFGIGKSKEGLEPGCTSLGTTAVERKDSTDRGNSGYLGA